MNRLHDSRQAKHCENVEESEGASRGNVCVVFRAPVSVLVETEILEMKETVSMPVQTTKHNSQ